jgi:hypothetical protein
LNEVTAPAPDIDGPSPVTVAGCPLRATTPDARTAEVTGTLVDVDGESYYRVTGLDALPPFLMSLVSDSDHWLFVSSNGGLTAGRRGPEHAIFPYYTDDRIHDGRGDTGSLTVLLVHTADGRQLWEPFSDTYAGAYRIERTLLKSTVGTTVTFEETNLDLGLTFRYSWSPSERFGFVRTATLTNTTGAPVTVELLDGVQNLLPAGTGRLFQEHFSTLVDGHKDNELDPRTGLALFKLSSVPGDSAKPGEALRTAVAWSYGLDADARLLSTVQLDAFRGGSPVATETAMRGRRGAYLLAATLTLGAGDDHRWILAVDTDQDAADVVRLRGLLRTSVDLADAAATDVRRGTDALVRIVGSADGLQTTGDPLSAARHFSNALFNVMRGGIPDDGYAVTRADVTAYLAKASPRVLRRQRAFVDALPDRLAHADLIAAAAATGDAELERVAAEFLPLTFSRRHGDPSRPWNDFAIAVKDAHGQKILGYQGNWRDIFQNWEALGYSYPEYLESMIQRFLNASTADGNNPYRLTQSGFDWEVLDGDDPYSHVGYWGDHQVIYLLKLLETSSTFHPGRLTGLLHERRYTYADVPYRIRPYAELLDDPRDTIAFDADRDRELRRRMATDQGAFLLAADGEPVKVTLAEKLLVVALAKLGSFLPGAGIWLNTQRPEWNDANNALVGYGVSMVTTYQLRRYLAYCRELLAGADVQLCTEVATLLNRIAAVLTAHLPLLDGDIADTDRRVVLDALGTAAGDYRATLYAGGLSGDLDTVAAGDLDAFFDVALRHVDHTIAANRREDGLYHSYNLMRLDGDGIAVRRLYEMLEGQVALLGSGALDPEQAVALLDALRASRLYRADQNSYILYPDRKLPEFLEKNAVPADAVERSKLLSALVSRGDRRIVVRDDEGGLHFHADFANADRLADALTALGESDAELRDLVAADRQAVLDVYEEVFDHQSFTGRSGTFYKYEGLGCIYWHMVSKLLLAIQDVQASAYGATAETLRAHYEAVRDGIGVHKSPAVHGAIPIDPYSHTPGFAGAQQPGMTGQVKEDVIGRIRELGLTVTGGRIRFRPELVRRHEFLTADGVLSSIDVAGAAQRLPVPAGAFGFTFCQVPVIVHRGGTAAVTVVGADGGETRIAGLDLDAATSEAVFARDGSVARLDVHLG